MIHSLTHIPAEKKFSKTSLFLCIFLLACAVPEDIREGDIQVTINIPAGTEFSEEIDGTTKTFLPYITNIGALIDNTERKDIAVVGKRLKKGTHIYVRPFAKLSYEMQDEKRSIILAIPALEKYRSVEIEAYDDFITEHYAVKQIIEYWYANRYGLGRVSDVKWEVY